MRLRHYRRRTEQAYGHGIERFILFHSVCHPAEMGEAEINALLTQLAVKEKVSALTQNQLLFALPFLYRRVLIPKLRDLGEVIRARRPKRLPLVMTRNTGKSTLADLTGDPWLLGSPIDGAGYRLW